MWNGKKLKLPIVWLQNYRWIKHNTYRQGQVLEGGAVACGQKLFKNKFTSTGRKNESPILEFLNGYQNFVNSKLN